MFIFNLFSVGFSSFCHLVVFILCILSFRKTEIFYASITERLRERGKNETRLNVKEDVYIMRTYLLSIKNAGVQMRKG